MNETLCLIAQRYSCRSYDGRLPEKEKLDAIALAAVQSPSSMNKQPWRIHVLTDKALIEEMDAEGMRILSEQEDPSTYERFMSRGGTLLYNAPCMFLVLQRPGSEMDSGIVSQTIALAAASLGLGSVICAMASIPYSGPRGEEFRRRSGFEEGWEFGISVLVGYAKGDGVPHQPDDTKIRFLD